MRMQSGGANLMHHTRFPWHQANHEPSLHKSARVRQACQIGSDPVMNRPISHKGKEGIRILFPNTTEFLILIGQKVFSFYNNTLHSRSIYMVWPAHLSQNTLH